jgi:threonine/homoserine/homoserine lactone efflux protein
MPIDTTILATFALFWIAIVPTPGPNILMVTHVAMTRTPRHVALAIAGNMAGIILLASLALLGWAALLQAFPWLRLAVNILGGAYLVYVGMKLIGRARQPAPPILPGETPADDWKTVGLGFVTAISNAQAILFITSIYAVTGVLQANLATGFATVAIMVAMNASYLFLLGWLFRREPVRRAYQRFRRGFEGTVGALFLFFGGRLIWRAVMR